jgi:hypothetical protein
VNNPLKYTDPTGEFFFKNPIGDWWDSLDPQTKGLVVGFVVAVAVTAACLTIVGCAPALGVAGMLLLGGAASTVAYAVSTLLLFGEAPTPEGAVAAFGLGVLAAGLVLSVAYAVAPEWLAARLIGQAGVEAGAGGAGLLSRLFGNRRQGAVPGNPGRPNPLWPKTAQGMDSLLGIRGQPVPGATGGKVIWRFTNAAGQPRAITGHSVPSALNPAKRVWHWHYEPGHYTGYAGTEMPDWLVRVLRDAGILK